MQRVRIGLTGLAFVFLAVLLAAIFSGRTIEEEPITPNFIERHSGAPPVTPNAIEMQPTEPLAELGVAPGNADANAATPAGQRP